MSAILLFPSGIADTVSAVVRKPIASQIYNAKGILTLYGKLFNISSDLSKHTLSNLQFLDCYVFTGYTITSPTV